jgi:hypothetical protein
MYRFSPFPNEVTVMNTFYLRNVAPAVVATLCFFATVAGCQSHEIEQRAEAPAPCSAHRHPARMPAVP